MQIVFKGVKMLNWKPVVFFSTFFISVSVLGSESSLSECGKNQTSIKDRIRNCASYEGSEFISKSGVVWKLVARSKKLKSHNKLLNSDESQFNEVWFDTKNSRVWGDLVTKTDWDEAIGVCKDKKSDLLLKAVVGIKEIDFSLPSMGVVRRAVENGLAEVYARYSSWYHWSSTSGDRHFAKIYSFSGSVQSQSSSMLNHHLVRCQSRVNLSPYPFCSDLNGHNGFGGLKEQPEGSICVTAEGTQFKRVKNGFEDLKSGLFISDEPRIHDDHYNAEFFCKAKGLRLPTGWPEDSNGTEGFPNHDSELIALQERGFREALYDTVGGSMWSSTIYPGHDNAYVYILNGRFIELKLRDGFSYIWAHCVGPAEDKR